MTQQQTIDAGDYLVWRLVLITAAPAAISLALGVLHGQWQQVPAFGYWEVFALLAALLLVATLLRREPDNHRILTAMRSTRSGDSKS